MKAALYVRCSTEEQTRGFGLDVQTGACRQYADRKGWTVADVYSDGGVSGTLTTRPEFDRMMADVRAGRVDVVVVYRLDRVARTVPAFYRLHERLNDHEVAVVSTMEDVDTSTAAGKLMVTMLAGFAELELNTIRTRTQSGLQAKAEAGGYVGGAIPYGWRVDGKGREAVVAVDAAESATLRAAWAMAVEDGLNTRGMAARLNAEGRYTRSGAPWSHSNLRAKLLSESTLYNRTIFRNRNRSKAGHGVKLGKDGSPMHGEPVTVGLPPIFTADEAADLSRAMGRLSTGKPKSKAHGYPLSKRLFNTCGAHYVGLNRTSRPGRWYRCSGKAEAYPGSPKCTCDMVDADAIEAAVWGDVVGLLGDPARLKAMAAEWVGMAEGDQTNHGDRIADLDRQIKEREQALTKLVTDYAKLNLPADTVQAVTRGLTEELEQLQAMRNEATAWLEETEAAEQRAHDLAALADVARTRLHDMDPAEQAEVLALLDVRVTITGPVPRPRVGLACSMAEWFKTHERLVPDELTDEAWALVEPTVTAWEPPNHKLRDSRVLLNAMFYKARTGVLWSDLPERFGLWRGIHSRYKTWRKCGLWDEVMAALPDAGSPVWTPPLVPPLRVEGRVDPRAFTGADADIQAETVPAGTGVPGPCTSGLSQGVHELLRGDAQLVTDAAEVIELVGRVGGDLAPERRGPVFPRDLLAPPAARVLEALPARGGAESGQIARSSGIPADDTLGRLYELQALGFVERDGTRWKLAGNRRAGRSARTG